MVSPYLHAHARGRNLADFNLPNLITCQIFGLYGYTKYTYKVPEYREEECGGCYIGHNFSDGRYHDRDKQGNDRMR